MDEESGSSSAASVSGDESGSVDDVAVAARPGRRDSDDNTGDDGLIAQFMDVTGASQQEARELLMTSNQNLQTAVQNYFAMQDGGGGGQAEVLRENQANELRQRRIQQHEQVQQVVRNFAPSAAALRRLGPPPRRPQTWWEWLTGVVSLPFYFGWYLLYGTYEFFMTLFGRRPITAGSPRQDVLNFIERYSSTYNTAHPVFYTDSYSAMLREAKRDLRFALVYLHSWPHQDTNDFCRTVLCDDAFLQLVNEHNLLFWACDVQSREGYSVSQAVRESTYPSLSLIAFRDNRMALVSRIQGLYTPQQITDALRIAINENQVYVNTARQERNRVQQDQNLRREQEAAYQELVAQDRLKKQQADEEKRNADKLKQKEKRKEERRQRKTQDLDELRDRLRESMAECEPKADDKEAVKVCLRFPNGQRAQRAFRKADSLTALYNYAFVQPHCPSRFSLWTSEMPKRLIECAPAWTADFCGDSSASESSDHEESTSNGPSESNGTSSKGSRMKQAVVDEANVGTFGDANLDRAVILVQDDDA